MRIRNVLLGAVVVAAAATYAVDRLNIDLLPHAAVTPAAAAAPPATPVPVVAVAKATIPVTLDYAARVAGGGVSRRGG